jgi:hypothetical protein
LRNNDAHREIFVRYCLQGKVLAEALVTGIPTGSDPLPIVAEDLLPEVSAAQSIPMPAPFGHTLYGMVGHFSSGWPVAYLIATVVFGIGLVIGAIVHVSQPGAYVGPPNSDRIPTHQCPIPIPSSIVARITGMVDCEWEGSGFRVEGSEAAHQKSLIHLGDRLALKSGMAEITYDTGARVILQGPVTYEVESPTGGYLSIGRLTAKLEKKSEVRGRKSESANQKSEIRNQKSPDLCPQTSDLFAIRTPAAIVTDLGTEFGVEVDKHGRTTSHVFRGSVRLEVASADGKATRVSRVLYQNESAKVDGSVILNERSAVRSQFPQMLNRRMAPLVALYTFDGNGMDISGNDHHVSPEKMNDIAFVEGTTGQAARFDANAKSYVDLPIDASPTTMPKLTWGAWVRPRTVGPKSAEIITTDSAGYGRTITINDQFGTGGQAAGEFRFAAFLGDQGLDRGIFPSSGPRPKPNVWTFVAAVYDDSIHRVCLFVEDKSLHGGRGGLVENRTLGAQFGPCHRFIRLGRHADWQYDTTDPFDGDIDNVFLFRDALSAGELERIRTHGSAGILAVARGED